jgi:hypothetical protein
MSETIPHKDGHAKAAGIVRIRGRSGPGGLLFITQGAGVFRIDNPFHIRYDSLTARGARAESHRPDGRGNPLNLTRVIPA